MAKTFKYKKCGEIYTSDLGVCPRCFTPNSSKSDKLKNVLKYVLITVFISIIIIFTAILINVALSDAVPTVDDAQSVTSSVSGNDYRNIAIGQTLSADGMKITLSKVEDWTSNNMFVTPKDGYKFIRVYFTMQNTNSSTKYLGSFDFDCYADSTKMEMSIFGDDMLPLGTDISAGRSVQGYIYYEVPVNSKSIEIEYGSDWWGKNKAIFVVK